LTESIVLAGPPLGVTLVGENVHVRPATVPHENVTVPLKPPLGVTVICDEDDSVGETVIDDGFALTV
jgi:hypothetical protein